MNTATLINSKSTQARSLRHAALAALVCVLGTATSWAAPGEARSITVRFADLDLSSIAGAKTLYHRIQAAASQVCRPVGTDPIEQFGSRACARKATADAVSKVNNPLLTAVHTGRTPAELTAMVSKSK